MIADPNLLYRGRKREKERAAGKLESESTARKKY